MPIIDIFPIDKTGLQLNRTPSERIWSKLTNVAFRDGALVPRPGFKPAFDYKSTAISGLSLEPKPANGLVEILNPGSANEGRSGGEWQGEMLRPNVSASLVAGWTAGAGPELYEDIDEVVPDGTAINTTTVGAMFSLGFSNPSLTYDDVLGLRIYIRPIVGFGTGNAAATINIYQRVGLSNYLIASPTVYAYAGDETSFYEDLSFFLEQNKQTEEPFLDADLDSFTLAVEFASGVEDVSYYLPPEDITGTTGWVDAEDEDAAEVSDILYNAGSGSELPGPDGSFNPAIHSITVPRGVKSATADSTLVVAFAETGEVTFTDIDTLDVIFRVKAPVYCQCRYEIYYNNGSTDTLIDSGLLTSTCKPYSFPYSVFMTTNPVSGVAWTQAEVDAASFKFKILDSWSEDIVVEYALATISGTKSGSSLSIDTMSVEVIGPGTTDPPEKLVLSNKHFLRYDFDNVTFDDVTNSVASDDLPSISPFEHAILYGQVYVVNGVEPTKRYPNSSDLFESLTTNNADGATAITGRTVCAFANRILYGWVRDNTTYIPERVAYSKIFDGSTHNDVSAGDFDLIDTMGGVVALRQLNESLAFCGKQRGIYALRASGNSAFPIIPDPIDYETGCLSRASAVRAVVQGKPVILFLGSNYTDGVNVFMFDGSSIVAVGQGIQPLLDGLVNTKLYNTAIGAIDPDTNSYVLFMAENQEIVNTLGFAMNLNTMQWTRWDMGFGVYSAATWIMQAPYVINDPGDSSANPGPYIQVPRLILGGSNNLPMEAFPVPYDHIMGFPGETNQVGMILAPESSERSSAYKELFTSTIETGDIQLVTNEGEAHITSFRVHLDYVNLGPVRFGISLSEDGGLNYTDEDFYVLGDSTVAQDLHHAFFDLDTPANARRLRIRIRTAPVDPQFDVPFPWQINRIYIEHGIGAINGP